MKLLMTTTILAMLVTTARAADAKPAPRKVDAAVTRTAEAFFAAWNQHDIKGMGTFWADDATLINPMGRRAHGRAEIEKILADEQSTVFSKSTATLLNLKVTRSFGPNMAFCDGEMTVDGAQGTDGSALPQMQFHLAMVMERTGGHWLFAEGRPYALLPPPPPPPAKTN